MPNHTTNVMTVTGPAKDIQALKDLIRNPELDSKETDGEKCFFDFDKVVPMPKELLIDAEFSPKPGSEQYEIQKANTEKYGFSSWYEWSVAKWGTKWNSYWAYWNKNILLFYTAWSPPIPIIQALCRKFPTLTIQLEYADEGGGFVGTYKGKGEMASDVCHEAPEKGTPEGDKWAELTGYESEESEA